MAFRRTQPGSSAVYHRRSAQAVERRANQSSGAFESYIREDIPIYRVKEGTNILRVMPPPSRDYDHFGIDIFTHFGIGVNKSTYLCLHNMRDELCPVCEEHAQMLASFGGRDLTDPDKDALRPFRAGKRVLMYGVDRKEEEKGPQAWAAPWTIDRELTTLMQDKRTGEVLWIDDPENGFDIDFSRKGTGLTTKYEGISIARRESPLHQDADKLNAWLEFVAKNPLRDILVFREYEKIHKALHSTTGAASAQGAGTTAASAAGTDDGLPTSAEIMRMGAEELDAIADELGIDVDGVDDDELADFMNAEVDEMRGSGDDDPEARDAEARARALSQRRGGMSTQGIDDDIPF